MWSNIFTSWQAKLKCVLYSAASFYPRQQTVHCLFPELKLLRLSLYSDVYSGTMFSAEGTYPTHSDSEHGFFHYNTINTLQSVIFLLVSEACQYLYQSSAHRHEKRSVSRVYSRCSNALTHECSLKQGARESDCNLW